MGARVPFLQHDMESKPLDPFDPSRARHPVREVPLTRIVDLLPVSHAPERVALYRDQMLMGHRFPPVSVLRFGTRYVIADGHKRFSACSSLDLSSLWVEIWPVSQLLKDQLRQLRENARKNSRILRHGFSDPAEARRLALSTLGHWKRVALSLASLVPGPVRSPRKTSRPDEHPDRE